MSFKAASSFCIAALASSSGMTYDASGNLINDGAGHAFTYDDENRLTAAAGYIYVYDAEGRRVKKCSNSGCTAGTLYWTGTGEDAISEAGLGGTINEEYIFFNGDRVARRDASGGAVHYYFSDHLQSADVITSNVGAIQEESDYVPYGGEIVVTGSDPNHYKFTGKERDTESGLDYFDARHYANAWGRFMQPDWAGKPTAVPYANFGNPQSLNLYSYVKNNPTTFGDPDGHSSDPCGCPVDPFQLSPENANYLWYDLAPRTWANIKSDAGSLVHAVDTFKSWFSHPDNSGHSTPPPPTTPTNVPQGTPGQTGTSIATGTPASTSQQGAVNTSLTQSSSSSTVDQTIDTIDKGGFSVKPNTKTPGQDGNVTITHPNEPGAKLNLRSETHPLDSTGKPVEHVNVELVKPRTATSKKKIKNTHITK